MQKSNTDKKLTQCTNCKCKEFETNEQGFVCCSNCGLVYQKTNFDNNVGFGQQGDLQGKNIDKQQKINKLSAQRRLKKATNKIQDLVRKLQIPPTYDKAIEAAKRLLRYADNCNFFNKGKKIQLYAAAALYITLRFQKAPYLLIDFSDKMGIKMFPLARCFLKMAKKFGFQQQLPLIDPSLLIHKYCRQIDFGQKTQAVTLSAIRLIKRMKRDWMCQGRRPSSLCGAAILIATKIHGINNQYCSTTKICQTVFVCDQTIRRRLEQFKQTKISKLTLQEFQRQQQILGIDSEMDPPAFRKARLKSLQQEQIAQQAAALHYNKKKGINKDQNQNQDLQKQIPQAIIQRYSDQFAKIYQIASDRNPLINQKNNNIEELQKQLGQDNDDQDQDQDSYFQSNHTGKGQLVDQQQDNSDIDQQLIFLNEQQQQNRKKLWQKSHQDWLLKQKNKAQRQENQIKKKSKEIKKQEKSNNPFDALLKDPGLQKNVNQDQLRKLLASKPKLEQQRVSLNKIFDPFRYSSY